MNDTVYFVNSTAHYPKHVVDIIRECMGGYDREIYRNDIAAEGVDAVTEWEWRNVWAPDGLEVFSDLETAERAAQDVWRGRVTEITKDDVRRALLAEFGKEED